jgi:membrane fusion protein (multidrug efflux system)
MTGGVQTKSEQTSSPTSDHVIGEKDSTSIQRRFNRRRATSVFVAIALILAAVAGLRFFAHLLSSETTDDAFISVHYTLISSKVAGRVSNVNIDDNQEVKKGDILVKIDPRDFQAALEQKEAALKVSVAQAGAARGSLGQAIASLKSAQATVAEDRASAEAARAIYEDAHLTYQRDQRLFAENVIASQDLDNAEANDQSLKADLGSAERKADADQAKVGEREAQVGAAKAYLESALAKIGQSQADVHVAQLNDSYTVIRAPEDGRITNKSVALGNYIQTGQSLCALVPENVWVIANYKETQLAHMRPGEPAEIEIDALHRTFRGHVESIQSGSGAEFSLLPPENASGNYVKVVQRVPVKIVFDQSPAVGLPLGPGESVVPSVQVQHFHYPPVVLVITGAVILLCVGWTLRTGFRRDWNGRDTA